MVGLSETNLKPLWALEIKWTNRYYDRPSGLKSTISFCKNNKLSTALITTIDKEGSHTYDGIDFQFVTASSYAYTVGKNTLT